MGRAILGLGAMILALAVSAPAQPGQGPGRNYGPGGCWRMQANQDQTTPGPGMRGPGCPRMASPRAGGRRMGRPGRAWNRGQCPYRQQAQTQTTPAPAPDNSQKK